jgi:hypothetical protein
MSDDALQPIYSSRPHDPEGDAAIDRFVVGLGERVDDLQDEEAAGHLDTLAERARALVKDAEEAGYADLALAGGELANACAAGDTPAARKNVQEITEIAQRVRLGHKGAA